MTPESPSKILLVKTSAIGDVIQTFPVLEYLRQKFPHAQIDWAVEQGIAPLLRAHPQLDGVIEVRSKAWRKAPFSLQTRKDFGAFANQLRATAYDVLFDLQGNTKSAVVTLCAKARAKVGFNWGSVREKANLLATNQRIGVEPGLNVRQRYLSVVQQYFGDDESFVAKGARLKISEEERARMPILARSPRFMVCFGSKWPNKRLELQTLRGLLERIAGAYSPSFLFIFGDEEEKLVAEDFAEQFEGMALGNLSLPLWQAIMWEMDGVIAVDSAALHLCGTTMTPSFSVFGPSLAIVYKPMEERHLAVQGACPYKRTFSTRCPILRTCKTGACIRDLKVEELFVKFNEWALSSLCASALNMLD